jgi:hypothetical protein
VHIYGHEILDWRYRKLSREIEEEGETWTTTEAGTHHSFEIWQVKPNFGISELGVSG